LALSSERQSARMSNITNDSLTRSGTGCFIAVPYGNSAVNPFTLTIAIGYSYKASSARPG